MSYDAVDVIVQELQRQGVTAWEIDYHHNHPKIRFVHNGKPMMFVVPGSPSDVRGWQNSLTDLRKMMGVKRIITKSSGPKRRRNRTETKVALADLSFTVKPDPFASLSIVADRMKYEIQHAWRAGEMGFLSGNSGAAPREWPVHLSQSYVAGWWAMHALVNEIGGNT